MIYFVISVLFFLLLSFPVKGQEREQIEKETPEATHEGTPEVTPKVHPQANVSDSMKEIRSNLDQASQSIANHDYDASEIYLDKAVSSFQDLQGSGEVGEGELNQIENEIFITHQQTIIGQRKRELDSQSIPGKLKNQAQVPSQSHYYDMWSMDPHPWQPD